MTLQQKLDDFKSKFESGGPPYNAPKAVIEIFHRATEELRLSNSVPISNLPLRKKILAKKGRGSFS